MTPSGYVAIWRKIHEGPLKPTPEKPACDAYAWVWIIMRAFWSDSHGLKRGQLHLGQRLLGTEMGWTESRARAFLRRLERADKLRCIERSNGRSMGATLYTVVNYDKYQIPNDPSAASSAAGGHHKRIEKKVEEGERTPPRGPVPPSPSPLPPDEKNPSANVSRSNDGQPVRPLSTPIEKQRDDVRRLIEAEGAGSDPEGVTPTHLNSGKDVIH